MSLTRLDYALETTAAKSGVAYDGPSGRLNLLAS